MAQNESLFFTNVSTNQGGIEMFIARSSSGVATKKTTEFLLRRENTRKEKKTKSRPTIQYFAEASSSVVLEKFNFFSHVPFTATCSASSQKSAHTHTQAPHILLSHTYNLSFSLSVYNENFLKHLFIFLSCVHHLSTLRNTCLNRFAQY